MQLPDGRIRRDRTRWFNAGLFDGFWGKPPAPPDDPGQAAAYTTGYKMGAEDRKESGRL